jgi:hypothetical protein
VGFVDAISDGNWRRFVETQARNPETTDTRLLLKVLMAFKNGLKSSGT